MANPTTNYGFVMPTPTDLVTDLPADFGVFGQAVDTQMLTNANAAIAKTIVDAKGDLIGATAADTPARLAVGTNGQVLTADSTAATGLKWAAPATSSFVGCSVYRTTDQTLANNTTTIINWDAEFYDTDTMHDNSTNSSRITIPSGQGGKYLLTAIAFWSNNATGARQFAFYKNGVSLGWTEISPSSTSASYTAGSGSLVLDLAAADYVEVAGVQNSGGNLGFLGNSTSSRFQVSKIG